MASKYLILSLVAVTLMLILFSFINILQEAKKEKLEGELKSLIREGEEISAAGDEDFIFTASPFWINYWGSNIDIMLKDLDDMMATGLTHANIQFQPGVPQHFIEDVLNSISEKKYRLALEISAGLSNGYNYSSYPFYDSPELANVDADNGKQFLNASCLDYEKCEKWNSIEAVDPNYTGVLWQNTLNNTRNVTKRAQPELVLFDTEIWIEPQIVDLLFTTRDNNLDCNCNVTKEGIGYDTYYSAWLQRGVELRNAVKEVNQSINVTFYHEVPGGGKRCVQGSQGRSYGCGIGYMLNGSGDFPGPSLYVLPNLELLEINTKGMNLTGALPYVSFTYMYGYSNFFKYGDNYKYMKDYVYFDTSVSREAGRMLRQAGARGFSIYPNLNYEKQVHGDEFHEYWINHTKEMVAGFKEGLTYVEKNKIRNPGFEAFKTSSKGYNETLYGYDCNCSTLLEPVQFAPVFWIWIDSNLSYKNYSDSLYYTTANLSRDNEAGIYSWRHTREGDIGNRTIYSANFSIEPGEEGNYIFSIWTKASSSNGKIKFYLTNKSIEEKIGETSFANSWNEFKENLYIYSGNYTLKIFIEDNAGQKVDIYFDDSSLIVCEHTNSGVEICDSIDNDCDGEIDEGLDCGGGGDNGGGGGGGGGGGCIPENKTKTCLNTECGTKKNNCNKTIICGNCSLGFNCSAGRCINLSLTSCVAESKETTCGDWVCGIKTNNCGETIVCGNCEAEETCENGLCKAKETPKPSKIIELIKKYYLYGIIVLLVIGISIVLFFTIGKLVRKKKISSIGEKVRMEGRLREAKNLILNARRKGYSESFIKNLFLNKGWNEKLVEKMMEEVAEK